MTLCRFGFVAIMHQDQAYEMAIAVPVEGSQADEHIQRGASLPIMGVMGSKPQNKEKMMKKILVIASMMLLGSSGAWALTLAGEQIQNTVHLTYDVNGNTQTAIDANDGNGFVVDRKIDIQVVEEDVNKTVDVNPNQQDVDLTFTIANQGNDWQVYTLSIEQLASDDFDPTDCNASDSGGTHTLPYDVNISKEDNLTVKIQCNIPNTPTVEDDDNGTIRLIATANDKHGRPNQCENGDADIEDTVQNICADGTGTSGTAADGDYDGIHSDNGTYHVLSADLIASKTSCVLWDPVDLATNQKRIPGAVIRYAIQVENTGSADASTVTVTDDVPTYTTYGVGTSGLTQVARIVTETCNCASPGASNGDSISESGGTVTANFATISAGESECAYFDVTVD